MPLYWKGFGLTRTQNTEQLKVDLKGEKQLSGNPEQVWPLLLDPEVLAAIIPGCEQLERVEEDVYKGAIKTRLGPISSQYNASFKIEDKVPPHSYRLLVQGQGPGGFVQGDTLIELKPNDEGTLLTYTGTANVGGKIASISQRFVEAGSKMIIKQGMKALKKEVDRRVH